MALTLVAATFDPDWPLVELTFDRAIDIAGVDPTAIQVADDLITGNQYQGQPGGADPDGPNAVKLNLQVIGVASGGMITLTASNATGIIAVDDGGTWGGASGLVLPYP